MDTHSIAARPESARQNLFAGISQLFTLLLVVAIIVLAIPARAQQRSEIAQLIAKYGFKTNIVKPAGGILTHEYLVPAGPYTQLFDWDTYFMGVALSYDGVGKPLENSAMDFLDATDSRWATTGYTPRQIDTVAFDALPQMCKPFLAQMALRASETLHDYNWLRQPSRVNDEDDARTYYQKLGDSLVFWDIARRSPDGLYRWFNGLESGVDNNPAVSDNPANVTEGVDLQCYIYREYLAMAALATKLGNAADARMYQQKASALAQLVRAKMWSGRDGMFLNIDSRTGKLVHIKTWTNFVPLWVGIATKQQANQMIREHLLNPGEFWSPNGIRTIAATEPLYNPRSGYWRGPVWVVSNYMLMHGLEDYGYKAQAVELARKTVDVLVRDLRKTSGMNENYNPETGAPDAAGHFVSWDLLSEHILEEAQTGADPAAIPAIEK
ncbi:MAG TPA: trehalase family glycosidase [Candidatus Acidoferrales bacterium]|nr:trehalase family glycosidase [Candidatus Acidoferrales bacterium]